MHTIKVYCEGRKNSHDYALLKKITAQINVVIDPIGSKKNAEIIIQDFENGSNTSAAFLFFRDRDFDVPVPEMPSLTRKGFTFYSYRTTIENYLLDLDCFFQFLKERNFLKKYKITSIEEVQKLFIKAAKRISYYQALRHTLGKLQEGDDFRTTWMSKGSGHLPIQIIDKLYCYKKAFELINQTNTTTKQDFDAVLNTFLNKFEQEDFYKNGQYLIWFQGKDLAKALCLSLPNFPMASYFRFARIGFDYRQFDDFMELKGIIEQTLGKL